jgi:hypothetical protein
MSETESVATLLTRTNELLTTIAKAQIASILATELADPKKRKLYELTGRSTRREVMKKLGMSPSTISTTWQHWEQIGLVVKDGQQFRKVV